MGAAFFGAAAGGLAALGGSLFGGISANTLARKEGKRNREFQERMFRNRHQYTQEDLRAAGLNPALALAGSGLQVGGIPSGSMASQANPAAGAGAAAAAGASAAQKGARDTAEKKKTLTLLDANLLLARNQAYKEQNLAEQYREQSYYTRAQHDGQRLSNQLIEAQIPMALSKAQFDKTEYGARINQLKRLMEGVPIIGTKSTR